MSPRSALRGVAAAVAAVLLAGVVTVAVRRGGDAPAPAVGVGPGRPRAAAAATLEQRLVAPPAPARRLPDRDHRLGALDTSGVVALAGGSAQARVATAQGLALLGFSGALGHAWQVPGGVYVVIAYRFAQPSGASGLVQGLRSRPPGRLFASRTVPQAVAYGARSARYHEQHASFARGAYVYEVDLLSTAPLEDAERLDALLARQAAAAARLDP